MGLGPWPIFGGKGGAGGRGGVEGPGCPATLDPPAGETRDLKGRQHVCLLSCHHDSAANAFSLQGLLLEMHNFPRAEKVCVRVCV